ncbi:SPOR domain-containing protein [Maricaulaceae bacterium MS644]
MMRLAALLLCLALTACATTAPAPDAARQTRAQALAALLLETETADPARLAAAEPEMSALEAALVRAPAMSDAQARMESAQTPGPEVDLSGARSVMSAVHLASYREPVHAVRGWAELEARHGGLAGLQARVSQVDLGDRGVFLRLKAGPFDTPAVAEAACDAIKASGEWCTVTDFAGEAL